jgi:hypothetical protein
MFHGNFEVSIAKDIKKESNPSASATINIINRDVHIPENNPYQELQITDLNKEATIHHTSFDSDLDFYKKLTTIIISKDKLINLTNLQYQCYNRRDRILFAEELIKLISLLLHIPIENIHIEHRIELDVSCFGKIKIHSP